IAELSRRVEAARAEDDGTGSVELAEMETELRRIRQAHSEAVNRLTEARRDLENKVSLESIAARLSGVPNRARVLERLSLSRVRDELQHYEAQQQKWAGVY